MELTIIAGDAVALGTLEHSREVPGTIFTSLIVITPHKFGRGDLCDVTDENGFEAKGMVAKVEEYGYGFRMALRCQLPPGFGATAP